MGPAPSSPAEIATGGGIDAYETVLKSASQQVNFTTRLDTMESVPLNLVASTYFTAYASPRAHTNARKYVYTPTQMNVFADSTSVDVLISSFKPVRTRIIGPQPHI